MLCGTQSNAAPSQRWLLVVGDSGATGAATAPDLKATLKSLWQMTLKAFFEALPTSEIQRLPRHLNGLKFPQRIFRRIDQPENSFAAQVAIKLGLSLKDVVMVAEDGVQVSTLPVQLARLSEIGISNLAPLNLISFTANDFCDEKVLEGPLQAQLDAFQANLDQVWLKARPYLKSDIHGSKVFILAPFDVLPVLTQPELLAQKIAFEGQDPVTCGALRRGQIEATWRSWLVLRMLNRMCPSVTTTRPDDGPRLERLRQIQEGFHKIWKAKVAKLNEELRPDKIEVFYIEQTRHLELTTGDLANDCFHPSASGLKKTAEVIVKDPRFTWP